MTKISQLILTLWPNDEFSVGIDSTRPGKDNWAGFGAVYSTDEEWWSRAIKVHGVDAVRQHLGGGAPLGLSNAQISHRVQNKGLKGITAPARKKIRSSLHLIEKKFFRRRVGFYTFTLPALSHPDWERVHLAWGDIVRTLIQWWSRRLEAKGVPAELVYCTEIQGKRYEETGQPYFHLHVVGPARPKFNYRWYVTARDLRLAWERAVSSHCAGNYSFNASVDAFLIKKSVAAYLSKYLTKGGGAHFERQLKALPLGVNLHWWGSTKAIKRRLKANVVRLLGKARWLWDNVFDLREAGFVKYFTRVYIPTAYGGERCVGIAGRLGKELATMLRSEPRQEITLTF